MKKLLMMFMLIATITFGMEVVEIEVAVQGVNGREMKKVHGVKATGTAWAENSDVDVKPCFIVNSLGTWLYVEDNLALPNFEIKLRYENSKGFVEKIVHTVVEKKVGYFIQLPADYENGEIMVIKIPEGRPNVILRISDVTPPDDFSHAKLKKYVNKY